MPVSKIDIRKLTEWLGPEGAVAGLDRGHMTNADLMMLAREQGLQIDKKLARRQIAIEVVMSSVQRIEKHPDHLLEMSKDELQRYFADRLVSSHEIRLILEHFQIAPTGKLRGKLSDFAANEISDLGMYQRVAQGNKKPA